MGVLYAIADVVADVGAEQVNILVDDAHVVTEGLEGEFPDVLAVDGDLAVGNVVEPGQQVDDGGLAAAGGAEYGGDPTRFGFEVDIAQRRRAIRVGDIRRYQSGRVRWRDPYRWR